MNKANMKVVIKYNKDVDFLYALNRYAEFDKYESKYQDLNLEMPKHIYDFKKLLDAKLHSFQLNDLKTIFSDNDILEFVLLKELIMKKKSIKGILDLTGTDLFSEYIKALSIETDANEINIEDFENALNRMYGDKPNNVEIPQMVKFSMEFLAFPLELKRRLDNIVTIVLPLYLEFIDGYTDYIYDAVETFEAEYEEDEMGFLEKVSIGIFKEEIMEQVRVDELKIQLTMFHFYEFYIDRELESIIVCPEYYKLYHSDNELEVLPEDFYQTIADPKRINILKLLSKKSYYSRELSAELGLTPATTSYHASKLLVLGVIRTLAKSNQRKVFYEMDYEKIKELWKLSYKDLTGKEWGE